MQRTKDEVDWNDDRDVWWHDVVDSASDQHEAVAHDSEHPLFILYTSGTTGKPKGIFHTTGGYLTQAAYTNSVVHDVHPETDVYWCTADIGWVTGHSYIVYGPLANGATQVIYEGTPDTPHQGRWWEIVEKYGVSILYTAPTAIRTFMKWGDDIPAKFDLSSLRLLGSVGEPINPEAWLWYRKNIGGDSAPIVDTWWQTETGGIMISPLPGVTDLEPGSAQRPIPGISAEILDDEGQPLHDPEAVGYLVLTKPWPGMLRGIWGDPERYKETYWSRFGEKYYFAGDGAKYDEKGNIWLLGRVDDVMNVSGHRLSTAEIESALVSHPSVAEAAVVGATDETTGQAVVAFVILASRGRRGPRRRDRAGAAQPRGQGDRPDRQAALDHGGLRAAQDPLGQDHAPPAARRGREPRGRRRHHAGRLLGHEPDQGGHELRQGGLTASAHLPHHHPAPPPGMPRTHVASAAHLRLGSPENDQVARELRPPRTASPRRAPTRSFRGGCPATTSPAAHPGARPPRGGWRCGTAGVMTAAGEQPRRQRVGVPHLPGALLIAPPGRARKRRHELEQSAGGGFVGAHPARAVDGRGEVRDRPVAPAPDLVAEPSGAAKDRQADAPFADDSPVGMGRRPHRGHLDGEGGSVRVHHQGGVVEVRRWPATAHRGDRLVQTTAGPDAPPTLPGAQWEPVEVHAADVAVTGRSLSPRSHGTAGDGSRC